MLGHRYGTIRDHCAYNTKYPPSKFVVKVDVQHFGPSEVTVKLDDHGFVVIEAKHEEKKDDHGYISRHFVRRYSLPDWAKPENVVCDLSSDGVLSVTADKPCQGAVEGKVIPIHMTGQLAATTGPFGCSVRGCQGE